MVMPETVERSSSNATSSSHGTASGWRPTSIARQATDTWERS